MRRRGDTHRMVRWLWTSRRPDAKLARLALLPVSGLWRAVMAGRGLAYRRGWFPIHDLPLPPFHGGQDQEVEDGEDCREGQELPQRARPSGRSRHGHHVHVRDRKSVV